MAEVEWEDVDERIAERIASQGQAYLEVQFQASLHSDQRAMSLAGVVVALATALIGGGIGFWTITDSRFLAIWALGAGLSFLFAMVFALIASMPGKFGYSTHNPDALINEDDYLRGPYKLSVIGEAYNYQELIDSNFQILARARRFYVTALILAGAAPIIGIIAGALYHLFA